MLRRLHQGPRILVLPNVWDVVTARIVEAAGFSALATTSAGVAFALGYPDGERISRAEMVAAVRRIAARVRVPVTADMEAGYGRTPQAAAETAREVIAAGAVGMNLEDAPADGDGLFDVALQAERVRAARESAEAAGVPLVINARTDVFLASIGAPETRLSHAVRRLNAYRAAGADCLFAPGVTDRATIATLVREVGGPLNVLAGPGCPPVPELEALGVRRLSLGSGVMRATLGLVRRIAGELQGPGTFAALFGDQVPPHAEVNRLLGDDPAT
ncbi:MAG: 3-methyl-2-oxobutanoate hydroxymethyltransferase [Acidobacteria bacterium]|nr:MAG: 3-methyl-2-oxobutanoate hydroxymethyltransferase [Acidobacteriota bacterium]